MDEPKKRKIRTEFRKNREPRTRLTNFTREFEQHGFVLDESARQERVTGKGDRTRKRTVVGQVAEPEQTGLAVNRYVDPQQARPGRVLLSQGLFCQVQDEQGGVYACTTRGLLKTMSTLQRHVVATGDQVSFRVLDADQGIIERIEPRYGVLCRTSRGRQHVIVVNVDQLLIIASAASPDLKPHLIDRLLVTAEKAGVRPLICINKADLVDIASLQPLLGVYGQMGYAVMLVSATSGLHVDRLRHYLTGRETVVIGQSGVGKSSLLNAVQPGLDLAVRSVSAENDKGRHTTTTARLIPLQQGGFVVDTPGIRQFQLWDVIPCEIENFFRDIRPYVHLCRFPNCTHRHEAECAVKHAVADGWLDARRYESYCGLLES